MSELSLRDLRLCFEGAVPAVVATAAADGTPNITHLSKVHYVDDEHVALSNQFFSKTTRNLAENPRASMMVIAPSYEQYRLELRYERTERRGPVFDGLARDVETIAARAQQLAPAIGADAGRLLDWCAAFAGMVALEMAEAADNSRERVETLVALASRV